MTQKISSHRCVLIKLAPGRIFTPAIVTPAPMALSRMKFTSDHEPDAIPDISADCSRGNAYEPTFSATIWNPPPMNVDSPIRPIAIGTDVVIVTKPSVSETMVSSMNMPIGRGLLAA